MSYETRWSAPQPRLKRAYGSGSLYPMTNCAQQRTFITKRSKVLQETIASIAERDSAFEQLARAALPFDQNETSIVWAPQEVGCLTESLAQTGAADIPRA